MQVGDVSAKLWLDDAQYRRGLEQTRSSLQNLQATLRKVALGASAVLAGTGLVFRKAITESNRLTAALLGLESVARGMGQSVDEAKKAAQDLAADGLMTVADAATGLKNLLARGFSLPEAIDLMNRFRDSAAFGRQASLSFGDAVRSATEGLKNENSILVDNAGVTKNVSIMWKEYAAQIGKSVTDLTIAEKRQAEYNGILQETRHQVGDVAKLTATAAGEQAKFSAEITKTYQALGQQLEPSLRRMFEALRPVVEGFREWLTRGDLRGALNQATAAMIEMGRGLQIVGQFLWEHRQLIVSALSAWFTFRAANLGVTLFRSIMVGIEKARYALTLFQMGLRDVPGLLGKVRAALTMLTSTNPILLAISAAVGAVIYALLRIKEAEGAWSGVLARIESKVFSWVAAVTRAVGPVINLITKGARDLEAVEADAQKWEARARDAERRRRVIKQTMYDRPAGPPVPTSVGAAADLGGLNVGGGAGTAKGPTPLEQTLDAIDYKLRHLTNTWSLYEEENRRAAETTDFAQAHLDSLREKAATLQHAIAALAFVKAADADETRKQALTLQELRIELAKTKNQIDEVTSSMQKMGRATASVFGYSFAVGAPPGVDPERHREVLGRVGAAVFGAHNVGGLTPEQITDYLGSIATPQARGGIWWKEGLARVAEATRARPEVVSPLRDLLGYVKQAVAEVVGAGAAGVAGAGTTVVVPVYLDGREIARYTVDETAALMKQAAQANAGRIAR